MPSLEGPGEAVLVTGGCGFVGRHLVKKLMESQEPIWIVDNLFTGLDPEEWLTGFERKAETGFVSYSDGRNTVNFVQQDALKFFMANLNDESGVALPNFKDVFHLASVVGGRALIDGDPLLVATDLAIDSLFFLWVTRAKIEIERILYTSSSAAYPVNLQMSSKEGALRLTEDMISFDSDLGQPDMTYGWSKLSGEYLARLSASRYGLKVACVRPFSGYGEDQDLTYPIPAIAQRIAAREDPLTIWGTGDQGRDFVYIDDCIDAMLVVLDNVSDGSAVNIASGQLTTFKEVAQLYADIEGYTPEIKPLIDKPMGVQSRYGDPALINSLGWKPKVTLREGLEKVLKEAHKAAGKS